MLMALLSSNAMLSSRGLHSHSSLLITPDKHRPDWGLMWCNRILVNSQGKREKVKRACQSPVIQYSTGCKSFHIFFCQDNFMKFSAITVSLCRSHCFTDSRVPFAFFCRVSVPTPWQQDWTVWCQCIHDVRSSTHWRIWASMHLLLSLPQSRSDTATVQPQDSLHNSDTWWRSDWNNVHTELSFSESSLG